MKPAHLNAHEPCLKNYLELNETIHYFSQTKIKIKPCPLIKESCCLNDTHHVLKLWGWGISCSDKAKAEAERQSSRQEVEESQQPGTENDLPRA